jgi:hypothetical protein
METIVNKHVDKLETIEAEVEKLVGQVLKRVNIKALMLTPRAELDRVNAEVYDEYLKTHVPEALKAGVDFAQMVKNKIEADKEIPVPDTGNPKLNA